MKKRFRILIATMALIISMLSSTMVYAESNTQELLNTALTQKTFYSYNMAYSSIMNIQDTNARDPYLWKLATITQDVLTPSVNNFTINLDTLCKTSSGKLYDQIVADVQSSNLCAMDKGYLLGELTGWGRKLVYTSDYTSAIDALNIAWSKKDTTSINVATNTIALVKNQASKDYLTDNLKALNATLVLTSTPMVATGEEYRKIIKNALENFDSYISIEVKNYDKSVYNLGVINSVLDEFPNLDYGYTGAESEITWKDNSGIRKIDITLKYSKAKTEMVTMKAKVQEKAALIINNVILPNMSDFDKELAIHDYIVLNTKYDYDNYLKNTIPNESYHTYGIIVNGIGVCQGYAEAMKLLLDSVGIDTVVVGGAAGGGSHAWNIVKIDGYYYQLDTTWDDPVPDVAGKVSHEYFNISDSKMSIDHTWNSANYVKCTSAKYENYKFATKN